MTLNIYLDDVIQKVLKIWYLKKKKKINNNKNNVHYICQLSLTCAL